MTDEQIFNNLNWVIQEVQLTRDRIQYELSALHALLNEPSRAVAPYITKEDGQWRVWIGDRYDGIVVTGKTLREALAEFDNAYWAEGKA